MTKTWGDVGTCHKPAKGGLQDKVLLGQTNVLLQFVFQPTQSCIPQKRISPHECSNTILTPPGKTTTPGSAEHIVGRSPLGSRERVAVTPENGVH